jgi:heme-degrading monooxygenase HmoA
MREQPGFRGAEIMVDDDRVMIASRWETDEQAHGARGRAKAHHSGRHETRGHYSHVGPLTTYSA